MHLVRHMKSSTSESKSNFCRSSRIERRVDPNTNLSILTDSYVDLSVDAPNQMIRFGSCKDRRMNRALCPENHLTLTLDTLYKPDVFVIFI